ncbi:MAG: PaaI family thioesterase [Anaerovoracaceae bacterium]
MDYNKLVDYRNTQNAFGRLTGCEVTHISEGKATVIHRPVNDSLNPAGSVHGGLLFTMADIAVGSAASSYGSHTTTVCSSFNYLRPALEAETITATAVEIKHGKRLMVFNVIIEDESGTLLCNGSFTCMSLARPITL